MDIPDVSCDNPLDAERSADKDISFYKDIYDKIIIPRDL